MPLSASHEGFRAHSTCPPTLIKSLYPTNLVVVGLLGVCEVDAEDIVRIDPRFGLGATAREPGVVCEKVSKQKRETIGLVVLARHLVRHGDGEVYCDDEGDEGEQVLEIQRKRYTRVRRQPGSLAATSGSVLSPVTRENSI